MDTTDIEKILEERAVCLDIYDTAPDWGVRLWAREDPTISVFGEGASLADAIADAVDNWDDTVSEKDGDSGTPPTIYGNTNEAN